MTKRGNSIITAESLNTYGAIIKIFFQIRDVPLSSLELTADSLDETGRSHCSSINLSDSGTCLLPQSNIQ